VKTLFRVCFGGGGGGGGGVVVVEKEIFVSSLSFRGGKSKNKQQSQG
jgi:hypothetical protein